MEKWAVAAAADTRDCGSRLDPEQEGSFVVLWAPGGHLSWCARPATGRQQLQPLPGWACSLAVVTAAVAAPGACQGPGQALFAFYRIQSPRTTERLCCDYSPFTCQETKAESDSASSHIASKCEDQNSALGSPISELSLCPKGNSL